jgi:hypothetical protein
MIRTPFPRFEDGSTKWTRQSFCITEKWFVVCGVATVTAAPKQESNMYAVFFCINTCHSYVNLYKHVSQLGKVSHLKPELVLVRTDNVHIRSNASIIYYFVCNLSVRNDTERNTRSVLALAMEEASTSETSVNVHKTTQRNIPDDNHIHDWQGSPNL